MPVSNNEIKSSETILSQRLSCVSVSNNNILVISKEESCGSLPITQNHVIGSVPIKAYISGIHLSNRIGITQTLVLIFITLTRSNFWEVYFPNTSQTPVKYVTLTPP